MAKFSDTLISFLLEARTLNEMVSYYTDRALYKMPQNLEHNMSNIGVNLERVLSGNDENAKTQVKNYISQYIRQIIRDILDTLEQNNLLPYTEFVLYRAQDKRLPEDMDNIVQSLKAFDQLKRSNNPNVVKDIQRFSTFSELQTYLEPFLANIEKEKYYLDQDYTRRHQETGGARKIYDDGTFTIYTITKADASADLCRNTGWCVKDPQYFEHYNISESNPLYLISKNNYKYALMEFGSNQLKDPRDEPANDNMVKELYPIFKKLGLIEKISGSGDFDAFWNIPEFAQKIESQTVSDVVNFAQKADNHYQVMRNYYDGPMRQTETTEFNKTHSKYTNDRKVLEDRIKYIVIHKVERNTALESALVNFLNTATTEQGIKAAVSFVSLYLDQLFYRLKESRDNLYESAPEDAQIRETQIRQLSYFEDDIYKLIDKRKKELGVSFSNDSLYW